MRYCFEKREREGWNDNISVIRLVPNLMDKFDLGWKDGHYVTNITHSLMFFGATVLRNGTGYLVVFQIFSIHP